MASNAEAGKALAVLDEAIRDAKVLGVAINIASSTGGPWGKVEPSLAKKLEEYKRKVDLAQENPTKRGEASKVAQEVIRQMNGREDLEELKAEFGEGQGLVGLREVLGTTRTVMQRRLRTTVEEEESKNARFEQAQAKEQQASKEKQSLSQQLELERSERGRQVAQMEQQERCVLQDLEKVETNSKERAEKLEEEAKESKERIESTYEERRQFLESEVERLQQELEKTKAENAAAESDLQKKKHHRETQLEEWIVEYNQTIGKLQADIASVQSDYDACKRQADDLQASHDAVRKEIERFETRKRSIFAFLESLQRERLRSRAASTIRHWASHHLSQASRSKGQSKKKKGTSSAKSKAR